MDKPRPGLLAGSCLAVEVICHHLAISLTKAAYMLAVKRLNTLISVIYGGVVFKEANIKVRLAGTVLMTWAWPGSGCWADDKNIK